jgi:spore germination protein GerM
VSNSKRVSLALLSVFIGMGLGVVVLFATRPKPRYVSPYAPGAQPPAVPEPSPELLTTPEPSPTPEPGKKPVASVTFYRVVESPDGPALHPETRPVTGEKPTDEARLAVAIQAMAEGDEPILPKGTTLLRLKVDGKLALLDLSKELKENFAGGDRAERLAINALLATAGQLPGVEKVQIFVDGAVVETLGGTQSLLEPLSVPLKD